MAQEIVTLTVFFDGLCQLCSREIAHYRSSRGADQIYFVDITSPQFDAQSEGLDPRKIHKHLHARDTDGNLFVGVDAFIQIWKRLPALKFLSSVANHRPIRRILEAGYALFARVRPYLPRKACTASPFCDLPRRS